MKILILITLTPQFYAMFMVKQLFWYFNNVNTSWNLKKARDLFRENIGMKVSVLLEALPEYDSVLLHCAKSFFY